MRQTRDLVFCTQPAVADFCTAAPDSGRCHHHLHTPLPPELLPPPPLFHSAAGLQAPHTLRTSVTPLSLSLSRWLSLRFLISASPPLAKLFGSFKTQRSWQLYDSTGQRQVSTRLSIASYSNFRSINIITVITDTQGKPSLNTSLITT